jgi:hypothetical protein
MLSPPATGIDMLLGAVGADIAEIELPAGSCSARRAGNRLGVLPGGAPAIQEACQEAIWRCFPEARGRSRHLFAFRQKAPGLRGDRPCAPALLERRRSTDMTEGGGKCKFIRLSEHGSQQPRNQPSPPPPKRRTEFGDGTFLACVGVVLGVVLARELPEASFFWGKRQGDSRRKEITHRRAQAQERANAPLFQSS